MSDWTATGLVFFGDSLSDDGTFRAIGEDVLTHPWPWGPYGPEGFTDGEVWAQTLSGLLGAADRNYAIGGAEAVGSKLGAGYIDKYSTLTLYDETGAVVDADGDGVFGEGDFSIIDPAVGAAALDTFAAFDINLTAQVDRYLGDLGQTSGGVAAPDTAALILIGANDFNNFEFDFFDFYFGNQARDFAATIGGSIEDAALRLFSAGVETAVLFTLPVEDFFPGFADANFLERDIAGEVVDAVNADILGRAAALSQVGEVELVRIDRMSVEILADRGTFGFSTAIPKYLGYSGDPTWTLRDGGAVEPVYTLNPAAPDVPQDEFMFIDGIHPSAALHDLIAVFTATWLTADELFLAGTADTHVATGADDFVIARGGDDRVELAGGNDVALGGLGNDTILGGDGGDILIAGTGQDVLSGGAGGDVLAGGAGNDWLEGGAGGDILIGDLADSTISWAFADLATLDPLTATAEEAAIAALYADAQLWGVV